MCHLLLGFLPCYQFFSILLLEKLDAGVSNHHGRISVGVQHLFTSRCCVSAQMMPLISKDEHALRLAAEHGADMILSAR